MNSTDKRIEAMRWWSKEGVNNKSKHRDKHFPDRLIGSLTGREVEVIYDKENINNQYNLPIMILLTNKCRVPGMGQKDSKSSAVRHETSDDGETFLLYTLLNLLL